MEFEFYCPCGKLLTAEREWIGKRAQCPTCQTVLQVPKPNRVAEIAPPKRPKVKDQPVVQETSATAKAERPAKTEAPQTAKAQTEQEEQISQPSADENAEKQVATSESVESKVNAAESQEKPRKVEKTPTELPKEPVVAQAAQLHVDVEEITEDIEEPAEAISEQISEHKGGWECQDAEGKDVTESIAPLAKQIATLTDTVASLQSATEQRSNDSGISNKGFATAAIVLLVVVAFLVGRMSQKPEGAQGSGTGLDSEDNAITALQTVTLETDVAEHTNFQEQREVAPAIETIATVDSQMTIPPQAAKSVGGLAMSEMNTDAQFLIEDSITKALGSQVAPEAAARTVREQNVAITEAPIAKIDATWAARPAERVDGEVFEVTYNSISERLGKAEQLLERATPVVKVTGVGISEMLNNVTKQTRVALAPGETNIGAIPAWVPVDPEALARIKNQWSDAISLERLINCYERNVYLADTGEGINLFLDPVRPSVALTARAGMTGAELLRNVTDNGDYLVSLLIVCQSFMADRAVGGKAADEMLHIVVFPRRDSPAANNAQGVVGFTPGTLRGLMEVAEQFGTPTTREWWAGSNMQGLGMSGIVFWWGQVGVNADDDGQISHVLLRGPRG